MSYILLEKFRNKYRIESSRKQNWDYRWDGAYFVTICTKNMVRYFGDIVDGEVKLSGIGFIAHNLWNEIKIHADHVTLDAFMVMPDHVHGIIVLNEVGKGNENRIREVRNYGKDRFQNPGKNSLSSIVGSYKSAVTKHVRRLGFKFVWQARFHEHIIQDEASLEMIRRYIYNNPGNWDNGKNYRRP